MKAKTIPAKPAKVQQFLARIPREVMGAIQDKAKEEDRAMNYVLVRLLKKGMAAEGMTPADLGGE